MIKQVDTGLPRSRAPIEWALLSGSTLYTVQVPLRADGTFETGDIAVQTQLVFANLKQTVEAAGLTLADVAFIQVVLTDKADFPVMNEIYREFFTTPYPVRTTIKAELMVPGARIELTAQAAVRTH